MVQIAQARDEIMQATRLDPEHPWVRWAAASIAKTHQQEAGGPAESRRLAAERHLLRVLGLPTVWVPHSYPGCSQHAPNEHLPVAIAREGLAIMAGLYWDLAEPGVPAKA